MCEGKTFMVFPSLVNQSIYVRSIQPICYTLSTIQHLQRWPHAQSLEMSVAGFEAQDPAVTITDLLAYDEGQLVHYLKRHEVYGGFDISNLVGVETLSGSQREELAQRLW